MVLVFDPNGRLAADPMSRRKAERFCQAGKAVRIADNAIMMVNKYFANGFAKNTEDFLRLRDICGPIVVDVDTVPEKVMLAINEYNQAGERVSLVSLMIPTGVMEHLHQQDRAAKRRRYMASKATRRKEAPSPVVEYRLSKAALRRWRRKWWTALRERAPSAPARAETAAALAARGAQPTREAVLAEQVRVFAARIRPAKMPHLAAL